MNRSTQTTLDYLATLSFTSEQKAAVELLISELRAAIIRIDELEKRLPPNELPTSDDQISILNRKEFNREVARMLAFNERYGGYSSVVYVNIENLEDIRTNFDAALVNAATREIGNVLMRSVRSSDVVGRLAQDEFGILLSQCDNANAWKKAEELTGLLHEAVGGLRKTELSLKIFYGAYTFKDHTDLSIGLKEAASHVTQSHRKRP